MAEIVPKTFEEKLDRVDHIVKELESGKIPLERAIELFKEGKALARDCETLLRSAQEKIDKTMSDA
jgi:exodeoxyribonuclease VII small subunit